MYWVNQIFRDGSESDFTHSRHFRQMSNARAHATITTRPADPSMPEDGGECYIISSGTVLAHYRNGVEVVSNG